MANKFYKYSNLYSLSATSPSVLEGKMVAGELALGLKKGQEHLWAFDGTDIIDLGNALGGVVGDELTVHKRVVPEGEPNEGFKEFSSLLRIKDITADYDGSTPQKTLPANVKKRYALVNSDSENIVLASGVTSAITEDTPSEFIDIYKDSSIVSIYVGTQWDSVNPTTGVIDKKQIGDEVTGGHIVDEKDFQYLNYVYFSGGYSGSTVSGDSVYYMTQVDLTKFLAEKEFESGVSVNADGIVIGVVDYVSGDVITAWTDGDYADAGVADGTESGLTVGEDGFKLQNIQKAIDAKHANVIKMNGYSVSAGTEDLFNITSADTISKAIMKIENKICSNGNGWDPNDPTAIAPNQSGILFVEGGPDLVIFSAGEF